MATETEARVSGDDQKQNTMAEHCHGYHKAIYSTTLSSQPLKVATLPRISEKNCFPPEDQTSNKELPKISKDIIRWTWPPALGGVTGCCRSSMLALDVLCQAAEPAQVVKRDVRVLENELPHVRATLTCSCQEKRKRYTRYQECYFNPQGEIIFIEEWIFLKNNHPKTKRSWQKRVEEKRLAPRIPGLDKGCIDFVQLQKQALSNVWLDRIVSERRMKRSLWLSFKFHWILRHRIVAPPRSNIVLSRKNYQKRKTRHQKQVVEALNKNRSSLETAGPQLDIDIRLPSPNDGMKERTPFHPSSTSLHRIAVSATAALLTEPKR